MKKKLKIFFSELQNLPELQSAKCKKSVNQLKTFMVQIDKHWPYADDILYKRLIRKLLFLQGLISNQTMLNSLRKIQGDYHRKQNQQEREQETDFRSAASDSWCGVEFEY